MEELNDSSPFTNPLDAEIRLERTEDVRASCLNFLEQAQRTVEILSYDLDATLYDRQAFLTAVKKLCLRSQFSRVRILLQSNSQVQKQGHRLVELARRLPSSMEIRQPHTDYTDLQENFLLVDQQTYIRWQLSNRYRVYTAHGNKLKAKRLSDLFNQIWHCSQPDSALRRLYI